MSGNQTKDTYEDNLVVTTYASGASRSHRIPAFAQRVPGKRIIDIGCGPGHHAYHLSELGFSVTAIDYSEAMITEAKRHIPVENPPRFLVRDMRDLKSAFPVDSFDAAWLSASLLHIPESEVTSVLEAVHAIVVVGGIVHISLKEGPTGMRLVQEHKYGREIEREFMFWEQETFEPYLRKTGYHILQSEMVTVSHTNWLRFLLQVIG